MLRSLCGDLGGEPWVGVLSSHALVAEPLHPFAQVRASGAVAAAGLSVGAPMSRSVGARPFGDQVPRVLGSIPGGPTRSRRRPLGDHVVIEASEVHLETECGRNP